MNSDANSRSLSLPSLPGLELIHSRSSKHVFPLHAHAEHVISVVHHGAKKSRRGKREAVIGPGMIGMFNPFEEHASEGASETWTCSALYLEPSLIANWFGDVSDAFRFGHAPVSDPIGSALIVRLYHALQNDCAELDAGEILAEALNHFLNRYCLNKPDTRASSHAGVFRAREYLEAGLADADLQLLSQIVELSPTALLRGFRHAFGCTPRVYSMARRLSAAKRELKTGADLAAVAAEFGFCDQGHFTRVFHRWTGITPGAFARV